MQTLNQFNFLLTAGVMLMGLCLSIHTLVRIHSLSATKSVATILNSLRVLRINNDNFNDVHDIFSYCHSFTIVGRS